MKLLTLFLLLALAVFTLAADVDFAPGSSASGAGKGGDGGGGGRRPLKPFVPTGHYAKNKTVQELLLEAALRRAHTSDSQYVIKNMEKRRDVFFRNNENRNISKHESYAPAVIIQAYGRQSSGSRRCDHCVREKGPFTECVRFPDRRDHQYPEGLPGTNQPFNGVCGNCFWGNQGWRCTRQVGGAKTPPRNLKAKVHQAEDLRLNHIGNQYDEDNASDMEECARNLRGMAATCTKRAKSLRAGKAQPSLEEESSESEESWQGISEASDDDVEMGEGDQDDGDEGSDSLDSDEPILSHHDKKKARRQAED